MPAVRTTLLVASLSAVLPGVSLAATIDFETIAEGAYTSPEAIGGGTLSYAGGTFYVVDDYGNGENHSLAYYNPDSNWSASTAAFKFVFDQAASSFSIRFWDLTDDVDTAYLRAFDANGILTTTSISGEDGGTVSLTSLSPIAYVLFWTEGDYAGSVYWDDIRYEVAEVPLPGTLGLLGLGLAGLGLVRRRAGR